MCACRRLECIAQLESCLCQWEEARVIYKSDGLWSKTAPEPRLVPISHSCSVTVRVWRHCVGGVLCAWCYCVISWWFCRGRNLKQQKGCLLDVFWSSVFSLNREQPGLGGVLSHGLHIVCQIKNAPPGSNSTNTIHRSSSGTEIRSAACLASVISLLLNMCSYSKLMRSTHVQKFLLLL